MSYRYANAIMDPGLNTLIAPTPSYQPYLYSWGAGYQGGLGLGNQTNYSSPKQVGNLTNWLRVTAGYYSGFAIKTDGTLWSWGDNGQGQLGTSNTTYYSSPVQIGALTTWSSISCGYRHTIAIKTDGTLWTWGRNNYGQLGLGNITNYSSPKQVGALATWASVGAGRYFSLAIKKDGTLWSWGQNNSGQLGLNNQTYYSSPKQVGALTNWLKVSGGYSNFTVALKTDGTVWSWGYNYQGQLGVNASAYYYSSPKQIGALTTWTDIRAGGYHTLAVNSGKLYSWGFNLTGQLGLGNTTQYSSPKQVGNLNNWSTVAPGGTNAGFSLALKTDGTLWSWGRNNAGQLGIGTTFNNSSPVQVGAGTNWGTVSSGFYSPIVLTTQY